MKFMLIQLFGSLLAISLLWREPSWFDVLYFPVALLLFDLLEWATHQIMHMAYPRMHAIHHRHNSISAMTTSECLVHLACGLVAFAPAVSGLIVFGPAMMWFSWYAHAHKDGFVSRGHQGHHKDPGVNFGLLGMADRLMGTLR